MRYSNAGVQVNLIRNGRLVPISGAKTYFFQLGTNTPKNVHSDSSNFTSIGAVITTDSKGYYPDEVFLDGLYKVLEYDEKGNLLRESEPVGDTGGVQWSQWSPDVNYSRGDIREYSSRFYESIASTNQGAYPDVSPGSWTLVPTLTAYSSFREYSIGERAIRYGRTYESLANLNTGNNPEISPAKWKISEPFPPKAAWPTITINVTDPDHDVDFGIGEVPDSSRQTVIANSSVVTKQLDAAWVAGDGVGGLFSGSIAADTKYHGFLISKDSDGSVDAGFDTSPVAANIPAGYSVFKRLFTGDTDASANWIFFRQHDDVFTFDVPQVLLSTSTPSTVGASVMCYGYGGSNAVLTGFLKETTTLTYVWIKATAQQNTLPSSTDCNLTADSGCTISISEVSVRTGSTAQIRYRSSSAAVTNKFEIRQLGFIDERLD